MRTALRKRDVPFCAVALVCLSLADSSPAQPALAEDGEDAAIEEIVVTGTRARPRSVVESRKWLRAAFGALLGDANMNWATRLAERGGVAAPTGPAGSMLLFHSNLVHACPPNISPFGRTIVYLSLAAEKH